jgi:hypothetical protein
VLSPSARRSLYGRLALRWVAWRARRLSAAAAMAAARTLVLAGGCSSGTGSSPARLPARPTASAAVGSCRRQYASACYTPQHLRVAYGLQPLLDRGTDGRGQTVVLMEFANTPPPVAQQPVAVTDICQDLALFDALFSLPAARLQVDTSLAGSAWPRLAGGEEVEDAEIVHAVAPGAAIRVILISRWTGPGSWITALDGVLRLALAPGLSRLAQRHPRRGLLYSRPGGRPELRAASRSGPPRDGGGRLG